jgi:hypothetical protein
MPYLGNNLTVGGTSSITSFTALVWIALAGCSIVGDLVCTTAIPGSSSAISFAGRGTQNVTGTGTMCGLVIWQPGTLKLAANYTGDPTCGAVCGGGATFDMNGHNLSIGNMVLGLASANDTFKSSGGTLTLTAVGSATIMGSALELSGGTTTLDTVNVTNGSGTKTISLLATVSTNTIGTLNWSGVGGILAIHSTTLFTTEANDNLTISNFNITDGCRVSFHHGQNGTTIGNLTALGTVANVNAGNNVLNGTSSPTQATVNVTGTIKIRYYILNCVNFQGASAPVTAWDSFDFNNNSNVKFRGSWPPKVMTVIKG